MTSSSKPSRTPPSLGITDHIVVQTKSKEKRSFTLRIKKEDWPLVLESYLHHIIEKADELQRKNQDRLLYTNSRGWLRSVPFKHESTFDTLAMDPARKAEIMDDLVEFAEGRTFYERTGRTWKRGYLLYGLQGTGKSSMIRSQLWPIFLVTVSMILSSLWFTPEALDEH